MARNRVKVGNVENISGEVNIAARDIIKNIQTIHERALTAAEKAAQARKFESHLLAKGVDMLAQSLYTQAQQGIDGGTPYKGLLSYGLNEAEIFYGRTQARIDLLNCIQRGALTVLHAESGAGKSSLLQAGIAAQLIANGHLVVYLRPHAADPIDFVKRMFLPDLSQAPTLVRASLREFLRQVCSVIGSKVNLYLLIDQFEEFFQLLDKEERLPFLESLADCLNDPGLKVRWVLALRAEALSKLAELEAFGITPFKNIYRLNRLTRTEAREAITVPARRHKIRFEPALIAHMLDTLSTNDEVHPTHLQLVCTALTDDLPENKKLTLVYFMEQEGGTEGILRDYLKRQLENFSDGERALAWKILRSLITADRQRAVKTDEEIIQELKARGVTKKQIEAVLGRLSERRLLFTQPETRKQYELAHDYLVKEIELDPQEQARKAAQELLDHETRSYQRHKTLLTAERLAVIQPYEDDLRFSTEARALLNESKKVVRHERLVSERRRNMTVGASLAVAVGMSLLALWGFRSSGEAVRQAEIAQTASTHAVAQQETAEANAEKILQQARITGADQLAALAQEKSRSALDLSLLLGIEAWRRHDDLRTRSAMLDTLLVSPHLQRFLYTRPLSVFDRSIRGLAFSHDGNILAASSCGEIGVIELFCYLTRFEFWDMHSGRLLGEPVEQMIVEENYGIDFNEIAFSPNGKIALLGTNGSTFDLFDLQTGGEISARLRDEGSHVTVSPDGEMLAFSSSSRHRVIFVDFDTGQPLERELITEGQYVRSLAFSADGKTLTAVGCIVGELGSCTVEDEITVWDINTGEVVGEPFRVRDEIISLSPDGRTLAVRGPSKAFFLWDTGTGQQVGQEIPGTFIAFSPDGQAVATEPEGGNLRLWNATTGQPMHELAAESPLAFSPDGRILAAVRDDMIITLWDKDTGQQINQLFTGNASRRVTNLAFDRDGRLLAAGHTDGTIAVFELAVPSPITRIFADHQVEIAGLLTSPGRNILSSVGYDEQVLQWDMETGQSLNGLLILPWDQLDFNPQLNTLAASRCLDEEDATCLESELIFWDMATGKQLGNRHRVPGSFRGLSPDRTMIATANCTERDELFCVSDEIILWEVATDRQVGKPLKSDIIDLRDVAFSPDGRTLASTGCTELHLSVGLGCAKSAIVIWDLETQQVSARSVLESVSETYEIVFSPDENMFAVRSSAGIILWDVVKQQQIGLPLAGPTWEPAVVFSPDGRILASGGCSASDSNAQLRGEIRLWDVKTRQLIGQPLHGHADCVGSLAFSSDGKTLWSGSNEDEATILSWDLDVESWIEQGCEIAGRNFTQTEWIDFFPDKAYPVRQDEATCPQWPIASEDRPTGTPTPPPTFPAIDASDLDTLTPLASHGSLIDINTASAQDLDSLPGIGPTVAQRIVEYRTKNGPFQRKEDLVNVNGMGPSTLEQIWNLITVLSLEPTLTPSPSAIP